MKCYLAGPMRGIPEFNYPAFHRGAAKLRRQGWDVFSPAEHDEECGLTGPEASKHENLMVLMSDDLRFILTEADAVFLLPGWRDSQGARLEVEAAKFKNIEVVLPEEWWYMEPDVAGGDVLVSQTWSAEKGWN